MSNERRIAGLMFNDDVMDNLVSAFNCIGSNGGNVNTYIDARSIHYHLHLHMSPSSSSYYAHKLLISSEGAGREVHEESLGVYVLTGEISNDRPIYKNTKDNDRYLHFSPNSTWTISKKDEIGTTFGYIYNNDKSGEAPHLVDHSRWLVFIGDLQPINIQRKYDNRHDGPEGNGFWTEDPTFKVQVIG